MCIQKVNLSTKIFQRQSKLTKFYENSKWISTVAPSRCWWSAEQQDQYWCIIVVFVNILWLKWMAKLKGLLALVPLKSYWHCTQVVWEALWALASSIVAEMFLHTLHFRCVFMCFSKALAAENTAPHSLHVDPFRLLCFASMCLFKFPSFLYPLGHSSHLKSKAH